MFKKYEEIDAYIDEFVQNRLRCMDHQFLEELCNSIPEIAADIESGNQELQYFSVRKICFLLENLKEPPIDILIEKGIIRCLLRIMTHNDCIDWKYMRHDIAKALRRILDESPQARVVMDDAGVDAYAALLTADDDVLPTDKHVLKYEGIVGVEYAARLSIECRNRLLHLGVIASLASIVEQHLELPDYKQNNLPYYILDKAASALRWLCSLYPLPTLDQVEIAVQTLKRLINLHESQKFIMRDTCLALHFLARGSPERMNVILDAQVSERLVFLLGIPCTYIADPVLTFVENIFRSGDPNVQLLINSGILPMLHQVLSGDGIIQPEHYMPFWEKACNVISVFLCGGRQRVQMVVDAALIQPLLEVIQGNILLPMQPVETKLAAICTIANAARIGSFPQIVNMVNRGCLAPICEHLNNANERTRYLCVEGLFNVLRTGSANKVDGVNPFTAAVAALGGFLTLMDVKNDARAGERARMILMRYS